MLGKTACKDGLDRYIWEFHGPRMAGVAQSAEHRFCKPTVVSSTLTASSDRSAPPPGRWNAGRLGNRYHNESSETGWIPKWLKGPDCKSGGYAFAGSNPAPPMPRDAGKSSSGVSSQSEPNSHFTEWPRLPTPSITTCPDEGLPCGCNSMVEYLPSKQATWVRFPSPALVGLFGFGEGERFGNIWIDESLQNMLPWLSW